MTAAKLLHQIFYGNKKFDFTRGSIETRVMPFVMTTAKYNQWFEEATLNLPVSPLPTPSPPRAPKDMVATPVGPAPSAPGIVVPDPANTLFWSIFIGQYGYAEYLRIGTKYLNREMDEKHAIVKALSATPKKMKQSNYKITNVAIQEIMAEMSILQHDRFMNVVAYAAFYEKTIVLVFDHSYMVFRPTDGNEDPRGFDPATTIVVEQQAENARRKRMYGVVLDVTPEYLARMVDTKIRLEHYTKPMKGVSSYTTAELEERMSKIPSLEIERENHPKKWKKSELYECVVNVLAVPYQS
jgi:hypothetical protein